LARIRGRLSSDAVFGRAEPLKTWTCIFYADHESYRVHIARFFELSPPASRFGDFSGGSGQNLISVPADGT
jgi:hypothetical protein